jgi:hypothetical protein
MSRGRSRRLAFLAALLASALLLAGSALAAERGTSTFPDYRTRVTRARAAVHDAKAAAGTSERAATDLASELNALLPGTERVDVQGTVVEVDNSIVRSLIARLDASLTNTERRATIEALDRHLASLQTSVESGDVPIPSDPAALSGLLAQPQIAARSSVSEAIAKLVDRLAQWLATRFANAFQSPGSVTALDVVLALVIAALTALLGAIVWLIVRSLRATLAEHDRRYLDQEVYGPVIAAAEGLPADALSYAEDLARQGRFRDALRALFGGAARALVDRGLLRSTRTRTDAELLSDLGGVAPGVVPSLGDLAERFEYAWYGHVDPGAAGFEAARLAYGTTLDAVERTVSAEEGEAS